MGDWVATVAIGVISSKVGDYNFEKSEGHMNFNPHLIAFWAPFFLMHLGGPDAITAYALEDNELWLRHLIGLVAQTVLTLYIILLSWRSSNWLSHLSAVMLMVGFIKYGERTWSLYCASMKNLRSSFLRSTYSTGNLLDDTKYVLWFLYIFVSLFVDMVMSPKDLTDDRNNFRRRGPHDWKTVFNMVDDELKLMYDVFYTKAFANYGVWGLMSRFVTLTATIVVLLLYGTLSENKEHFLEDRIITHLLVVGAVISETYAFISVASSIWTRFYFKIRFRNEYFRVMMVIAMISIREREVLISCGQCNFLTLICNQNRKLSGKVFPVNRLEKLLNISHCTTSGHLQMMIFDNLYKKTEASMESAFSGTPGYRHLINGLNMPTWASGLEFHQTIITWHIATNLFHYSDSDHNRDAEEYAYHATNSKQMSDYMFYLLVKRRHMLPVGTGLVTLGDTVVDAFKIFKDNQFVPLEDNLTEACMKLLQHGTPTTRHDEVTEVQSRSVLFHACQIANELRARNRKEMWEFLAELWIEIMSHAGAHCRVDSHAQQLRIGPELLSHVWLLQAHLGLSEQFQETPAPVVV